MSRTALGPDDPRHGTANGYVNYGCRCRPCTSAHSVYLARLKANRVARFALDPSVASHGIASTYGNYGCRCRPCTVAWSADKLARRIRRKHVAA